MGWIKTLNNVFTMRISCLKSRDIFFNWWIIWLFDRIFNDWLFRILMIKDTYFGIGFLVPKNRRIRFISIRWYLSRTKHHIGHLLIILLIFSHKGIFNSWLFVKKSFWIGNWIVWIEPQKLFHYSFFLLRIIFFSWFNLS